MAQYCRHCVVRFVKNYLQVLLPTVHSSYGKPTLIASTSPCNQKCTLTTPIGMEALPTRWWGTAAGSAEGSSQFAGSTRRVLCHEAMAHDLAPPKVCGWAHETRGTAESSAQFAARASAQFVARLTCALNLPMLRSVVILGCVPVCKNTQTSTIAT